MLTSLPAECRIRQPGDPRAPGPTHSTSVPPAGARVHLASQVCVEASGDGTACGAVAMNVAVLYGAPGSRKPNGVGVFTAWERSKADPEVHLLVRYLVYWVAGDKVVFLALLAVIVVTGTERTKAAAGAALALSVAVFFWRLFPLARRADASGAMLPSGYSRTLGIMIAVMVATLALATTAAV